MNSEDKKILNGLTLTVNDGEVAAIMGPNGSGKSTLSYVIAGRFDYDVTDGEILVDGENILELDAHERAAKGLFLAFQYERQYLPCKVSYVFPYLASVLFSYRDVCHHLFVVLVVLGAAFVEP